MAKDAQEHVLTRANAEAGSHLDDAVRAFTLGYGDVNAHLAAAEQHSPDCPIVGLLGIWLLALSNDPKQIAKARQLLTGLSEGAFGERERAHYNALEFAIDGRWLSAVAALDHHLLQYPRDLIAHQCAMRLDGFLGRFHRTANRSASALPSWSKDQPSYGIMTSFYGFGLEELGDYARAEEVSRQAAELEPYGYWPHHAVSHVMEMTGRPEAGLDWMNDRQQYWSDSRCNNRVHIWWHKALFHIELGQFDDARAIYDGEILSAIRPVGTQLCNLTALLWRLEMLGCEVGDRWLHQHTLWQQQASGICSPFNEIHAVIAALRADDTAAFEALVSGMRGAAASGGELAPAYREAAVPIAEAMASVVKGDWTDAVDRLLPVRTNLWRMGGSIAQRDVVEWTLTEAAIKAERRDVALSLTNERLALRPESVVNQHFLDKTRAITV